MLSAEAGAVFGAHGMGQGTILRKLALLNVLWDGGEMAMDRRSKPSFVLRCRRLSFALMVQPEALRGFLERAGTLPRGAFRGVRDVAAKAGTKRAAAVTLRATARSYRRNCRSTSEYSQPG